ncbi:Cytochrome c, class I [hydrothermal vent metagenome]|uniref:Cytochrome c, class I n=1 Tax=hydrothermal vent metagenome TaxID=652676 RepID=A0A3B1CS64_9ZZZZ
MKKTGFIYFLLFVVFLAVPAWAADGKSLVDSNKCGSCHQMKGPAAKTIAEVLKRKAPDLFYAGNKFNKDWLVGFLQKPVKIRPAGTVYLHHIKTEVDKDVIVEPPLCASKLSAGDAGAVADYLMTLKDASMKTGTAKIGKFSKARAKNLMYKKEGCNSCHSDPKRGGGVSCPTFAGIGKRLAPDWIYSFLKDPQHWDPKIWMAKREFSDKDLQLMVNYLSSLK